jgi:hypothetical protein
MNEGKSVTGSTPSGISPMLVVPWMANIFLSRLEQNLDHSSTNTRAFSGIWWKVVNKGFPDPLPGLNENLPTSSWDTMHFH